MKISDIIEFKTPKKVYDKPQDYVDARNHRFDQMFGHPTRKLSKKKRKNKKRKSIIKTQLSCICVFFIWI